MVMNEPDIVDRAAFVVAGTATRVVRGTESPEKFREIWETFEARREGLEPLSPDGAYYGVSIPGADPGIFEHLAGMAIRKAAEPPQGLEVREIPAARYAVFECPLQAIGETYRQIFGQWLPRSGYEMKPGAPSFEQYPPREQGTGSVRIHVPIESE
jgi:predicted transcriptional regulator YdeE